MSAGNEPSWQGFNAQAGNLAVQLREWVQDVLTLNQELNYCVANGGLAGIPGFTDTADGNVLTAGVGNMAAAASALNGQGSLTNENVIALLVGLWGTQ